MVDAILTDGRGAGSWSRQDEAAVDIAVRGFSPSEGVCEAITSGGKAGRESFNYITAISSWTLVFNG